MALAAGLLATSATTAGAAVIDVTTTADVTNGGDGVTSLREAFAQADGNGQADTIVLGAGLTYSLTDCLAGELIHSEAKDLTDEGNGATIEQTCADTRLIDKSGPNTVTLTVTDATLHAPNNTGVDLPGAIIRSPSNLRIDDRRRQHRTPGGQHRSQRPRHDQPLGHRRTPGRRIQLRRAPDRGPGPIGQLGRLLLGIGCVVLARRQRRRRPGWRPRARSAGRQRRTDPHPPPRRDVTAGRSRSRRGLRRRRRPTHDRPPPGVACEPGSVEIEGGTANMIEGTRGSDWLVGTAEADEIRGLAGTDLLFGRAGDDLLLGGRGNDILLGGRGDDHLVGGRGNDTLRGGPGDDVLEGGPGRDVLIADSPGDVLDGGPGRDLCFDPGAVFPRLC